MKSASSAQAKPQVQAHSLPIKHVTLYKNDLAFLKRTGKVSTAQLQIAESIKELVSSTLSVTSEAPVAVLFGPNTEPVSEPDYGFQYGTRSNLGAFLDSLIGARVKLDLTSSGSGSAVCGHVLIVEQEQVVVPGSQQQPALQDKYRHPPLITIHLLCIKRLSCAGTRRCTCSRTVAPAAVSC